MFKVDSVNIWPATASKQDITWGQGVCIANMVPLQRLAARPAFLDLVKTINTPSSSSSSKQGGAEEEINELFSDIKEEKNNKKRSIEQMIVKAEEFQSSSEKQIIAATASGHVHALPPSAAKKRVQVWFESFDKEGRAGNVGLAPEPVRDAYPQKAPRDLDPSVRSYVTHFAEWNEKHK